MAAARIRPSDGWDQAIDYMMGVIISLKGKGKGKGKDGNSRAAPY